MAKKTEEKQKVEKHIVEKEGEDSQGGEEETQERLQIFLAGAITTINRGKELEFDQGGDDDADGHNGGENDNAVNHIDEEVVLLVIDTVLRENRAEED